MTVCTSYDTWFDHEAFSSSPVSVAEVATTYDLRKTLADYNVAIAADFDFLFAKSADDPLSRLYDLSELVLPAFQRLNSEI